LGVVHDNTSATERSWIYTCYPTQQLQVYTIFFSICLELEKQEHCEYTIALPPFQLPVSSEARTKFFAGCSTFTAENYLSAIQSFDKQL